ncbi:S-methyl-5-thioribose-1-phosphate isomerase [Candidatus Bathyarchaeota archaeon]|nr:MAG: S-methyl-5-thioribose-1-phosphate isomerase [Candidatus Bathyarchaeota archaeon]
MGDRVRTLEWRDGRLLILDQTRLPGEEVWLGLESPEEVAEAIRAMRVRGAPLIGAVAAYGLALAALRSRAGDREGFLSDLERAAELIRATRPTAVNLFWALERVLRAVRSSPGDVELLKRVAVEEANRIAAEDVALNRRIGQHGQELVPDGATVLTHCNAGALATVGYGTALGIIRAAVEAGKAVKVIATETRPLLQGARLTAYELLKDGIPVTLITDNMVGYVMARGLVDLVVVGADRIVRDGVFNKIGTYSIAILAKEHRIPFYVAAPTSTLDMKASSEDVVIEERAPEEVTHIRSVRIAPEGVGVLNPAFDFTPMRYITAIITEDGVFKPDELLERYGA